MKKKKKKKSKKGLVKALVQEELINMMEARIREEEKHRKVKEMQDELEKKQAELREMEEKYE